MIGGLGFFFFSDIEKIIDDAIYTSPGASKQASASDMNMQKQLAQDCVDRKAVMQRRLADELDASMKDTLQHAADVKAEKEIRPH